MYFFSGKSTPTEDPPSTSSIKMSEVKFTNPEPTAKPSSGASTRPRSSRPTRTPQPKQDSTLTDPKILRRPPSARQSMAMSVAHIALPDQNTGINSLHLLVS